MESLLKHDRAMSYYPSFWRFNPCFHGIPSQAFYSNPEIMELCSFNPCFHGIPSQASPGTWYWILFRSFNPCFHGIPSQASNAVSFQDTAMMFQSLFSWNPFSSGFYSNPEIMELCSFNPCFHGIPSQAWKKHKSYSCTNHCFNPCFHGIPSQAGSMEQGGLIILTVSILVFMESLLKQIFSIAIPQ